ncbi:MAG: sensor histidine kinase [Cellulomonas sp.]
MTPLGRRRAALIVTGAVVTASFTPTVAVVVAYGWLPNGAFLAFQMMLTLAGALLWVNPESRRHAELLLLASVMVGVSSLNGGLWATPIVDLSQISWTFQWAAVPVLATFLLSYPSGRRALGRRRILLALFWLEAVGIRIVTALLWDPRAGGYTAPTHWLTLYAANDAVQVIEQVRVWATVPLTAWFVAALLHRWRTARGMSRGPVRLVAATGIVLAIGQVLRELPWIVTTAWESGPAQNWVAGLPMLVSVGAAAALVVVALHAATRRGVVVERLLAAGADPGKVQAVLRDVLSDPTLRLRFERDGRWFGADGQGATDSTSNGRLTRVLWSQHGSALVELEADEQVLADPAGLRVTLAAASMVLENSLLALERSANLAEVSASRARIVEAGVAQRRQLERDLHDGAQQSLLAVAATLSRASVTPGPDDLRAAVADAQHQLTSALAEVRRLARGIHPAALSQGGLAAGVAALAAAHGRVDVELGAGMADGRRYPSAVESTAYYVVAESLTNAIKHGGGAVRILVQVDADISGVSVVVSDDGPGGADARVGGGLAGLQDRVRALGGALDVVSPVGAGTRVRAFLPLPGGTA